MSNMIQAAREQVAALTQAAYERAAAEGLLPAGAEVKATIEIPKDVTHGDYASSFAMAGAKAMKMAPRAIAQAVVEGNSHFYVTLDEGEGIYDFALPGLIEIVGYKEGDTISFTYVEAEPTNPVEEIIGNTKTNIGEKAAEETTKQAEDTADAKGDAA